MENQFLAAPRSRRNRALAVVGAALVVLTVGGLTQLASQSGGATQAPPRGEDVSRVAPTGGVPVTEPAPDQVPVRGSDGSVVGELPVGSRTVNGVRVGYPHTTAGAVAAIVEYGPALAASLEPDRASQVGVAVADDSFGDAASYFANVPVNARRRMGVPLSGPLPGGSSEVLSPLAYQVRDAGSDSVTVLLLAYLTTNSPTRGLESFHATFPYYLVWHQGDWKLTKQPSDAADYSALRRPPGTADAAAAGWISLPPR